MSFIPHPIGFLAGGLTEITMVASATNGDSTLTAPANIIAGDLLVIADCSFNSTAVIPTTVVPTGFTQASNNSMIIAGVAGFKVIGSYKLAVGTEGGQNFTTMSGTSTVRNVMAVFRGNIPALTLTLADVGGEATDLNPAAQTITSASGTAPLVAFGIYSSNFAVDPRSMSPTKDGEINDDNFLYLAWKIYNSAPVDVVVDMDDEEDGNILQSFYIQMAA